MAYQRGYDPSPILCIGHAAGALSLKGRGHETYAPNFFDAVTVMQAAEIVALAYAATEWMSSSSAIRSSATSSSQNIRASSRAASAA